MRRTDREVTDLNEIEKIVQSCEVCHMAMVDQGKPYCVTLNFGYEREADQFILYVHCATQGRKLEVLTQNPNVFITMDCNHQLVPASAACGYGWNYESIMAEGQVEIMESLLAKKEGLASLMRHYEPQTSFTFPDTAVDRVAVLKIRLQNITAKRRK